MRKGLSFRNCIGRRTHNATFIFSVRSEDKGDTLPRRPIQAMGSHQTRRPQRYDSGEKAFKRIRCADVRGRIDRAVPSAVLFLLDGNVLLISIDLLLRIPPYSSSQNCDLIEWCAYYVRRFRTQNRRD